MFDRRTFLKKAGVLTGAFSATSLFNHLHAQEWGTLAEDYKNISPSEMATKEDYWSVIQKGYSASSDPLIMLNNGGVSPSPIVVQNAVEKFNLMSNQGPSYYMWRILDQGRENLRESLAKLGGCSPEEIAINRNATEALVTVIYGLDLHRGDEVIGSHQDYPNMMLAWKQREMREGIVYKQLSFNFPVENDAEIVAAYQNAITPNTKILHLTHVINWTGQIMPVQKIARMAHEKGIEVIIDGAHSYGLLEFNIPDLEGDYFGTSLHKYLSAPIGSGMLWVKKEKISKVWPLVCAGDPKSDNIRKFENLGTRSFPIEQGIGEALNFHNAIGTKRKEERIRYLKDYWATRALEIPKVKLHTSLKHEYSCALACVSIEGVSPTDLSDQLMKTYKIQTSPISYENLHCVRISPHVYTKISDLDTLIEGLEKISRG
ncbi:aminotransferase class V-fold PLP-dependent enzyme [Cognataquiflexum rubidum]|uniref:aminotransferase class V-fold PLP-dependent enzyme n=1 Tax=Cognataquiflexum rubidum TaxID=2922273 RepID=UPI001F13D061|nr:aminotransferase class V-fold PLP-dependent enzyme [Cognataquiflexum rubidum]MCH6233794.1 aminotransferase class V-fold PLP-dependent enzyme [Cognataquiflexum rubidum]